MQFWRQQEKKTHGQIDWLIDCYYNSRQLGLLQITTTCYHNLRQLGYYNSRQLLFQFTTGITFYDIITIHDRTVVTRDDSQRRFLAQHSVAILEQCCVHSKQCPNNVATLCCANITFSPYLFLEDLVLVDLEEDSARRWMRVESGFLLIHHIHCA